MTTVARLDAEPFCVVILTYVKPIEEVDALMTDHVAFLKAQIAAGTLILTGRQVPRTGGVLIARGRKAEVQRLAETDPFVTGGAATIEVIEMAAALVADGIAAMVR